MRSRVMPGSLVTMARRVPVKRLKSVDLPTLGRPTMTSDGRRSGIGFWAGRTKGAAAGNAIFQCSAFGGCPGRGAVALGGKAAARLPHSKYWLVNTASPLSGARDTGQSSGVEIEEWTVGRLGGGTPHP